MRQSEKLFAEVVERLIAEGLIDRWFCHRCGDYVLYWAHEGTKEQSERLHNKDRHNHD